MSSVRGKGWLGLSPARIQRAVVVKLPIFVVLLAVAATTIYPLGFLLINSLKERTEYFINPFGFPQTLYLKNYRIIFENYGLLRSFGNSMFVVLTAVLLSAAFASLAAFAFAKLRFRGKRALFLLIVSMLLIPSQVLLIPIFLMFSRVGLVDSYLSVILMYSVTTLPFGVFLLTTNFRDIPGELIEAAIVDGASRFRVYYSIIIPMGRTAILTLATLNFLSMWNELLLALVLLPDQSKRLLTPAVASIAGRFVTNQPLLMTGLLITALPTLIVLILASRYLIQGISAGAGK